MSSSQRAALRPLVFAGAFALFSLAAQAQFLKITETSLPLAKGQPLGILLGQSAQTMFIDQVRGNSVARLSSDGTAQEFPVPTANSGPTYGVTGPDGAHWFTEFNSGQIGQLNPATGVIAEFPIPSQASAGPWWIVSGRDGALWFTNYHDGSIGRVTTSGVMSLFPIPTPDSGPNGLTVAWDGSMYFVEENPDKIGRLTTAGVFTEYSLPNTGVDALDITTGADGNLWFTEHAGLKIGRMTPNGVFSEFAVPSGAAPNTLAVGPDGAVWFTEGYGDAVGRITLKGTITEYPVPTANAGPLGISAGPNGTVVFTELKSGKIGSFPACGLGMNATYSSGTVNTKFELGVTLPATWTVQLTTNGATRTLFSKQIPAVTPVKNYSVNFNTGSLSGAASVLASLADTNGNLLCNEAQTLNLGN